MSARCRRHLPSDGTRQLVEWGGLTRLAALAKLRRALDVKLRDAANGFRPGNLSKACRSMDEFAAQVSSQSGKGIPAATASQWLADAARIKNVMGC